VDGTNGTPGRDGTNGTDGANGQDGAGANPCPNGIFDGSFTVQNALDVEMLTNGGCTEVTGTLTIEDGPLNTTFPTLVTIGSLVVSNLNPTMRNLSFPALTTIDLDLTVEPLGGDSVGIETLLTPALQLIGRNILVSNTPALRGLNFPALLVIGGNTRIEQNGSLAAVTMPVITDMGDWYFFVIQNGRLPQCRADLLYQQWRALAPANRPADGSFTQNGSPQLGCPP
jgi:hypothetical protein